MMSPKLADFGLGKTQSLTTPIKQLQNKALELLISLILFNCEILKTPMSKLISIRLENLLTLSLMELL